MALPGLEAALVFPLPEQASGQAPPEKPRGPQHPCPRPPLLRVRQAMPLCHQGNEQCSRKSWRSTSTRTVSEPAGTTRASSTTSSAPCSWTSPTAALSLASSRRPLALLRVLVGRFQPQFSRAASAKCPLHPPQAIVPVSHPRARGLPSARLVPRVECQASAHTPLSSVCAVVGISSAKGFIPESLVPGVLCFQRCL